MPINRRVAFAMFGPSSLLTNCGTAYPQRCLLTWLGSTPTPNGRFRAAQPTFAGGIKTVFFASLSAATYSLIDFSEDLTLKQFIY
jgi:hypothetical protein